MTLRVHPHDRIAMSQKDPDTLKVMHGVLAGERTRAAAARLLDWSTRHVRRLHRKREAHSDGVLVHGLRGQPSNHRKGPRLAGVTTLRRANGQLGRLLSHFNRNDNQSARDASAAPREPGPEHRLEAILSIRERRVVSNDCTIRFRNRFQQLLPPAWPGQRGGAVVIEERLDGRACVPD